MSLQHQFYTDPPPPLTQRACISTSKTSLVLDSDPNESSLLVQTGGVQSIYIDKYGNVGVNTTRPETQFEIASGNGACLRIRHGTSQSDHHADIFMNSTGDMLLGTNSAGSKIISTTSLDLSSHNGTSSGLYLGGTLVESTATQLNYVSVVRGVAVANKALVLNESKDISGINSLTAASIGGVLTTATQSNITTVGSLTTLTVDGNVVINGNIQLSGAISNLPTYIYGATPGAAIANKVLVPDSNLSLTGINSLSVLSLSINGSVIGSEASYLAGVVAGNAASLKALVLNSSGSITGINTLAATTLTGSISTASQPNITSVGTLSNLTVSGEVSASTISGTILTPSQPNITSVGTLSALSVGGPVTFTNTTNATSVSTGALIIAGGVGIVKNVFVGGSISVASTMTLTGGMTINDTTDSISMITGSLQTAGGIGIAKALYVGTTSSLNGIVSIASTSNAISTTTGALRVAGGVGIANALYVGASSSLIGSVSISDTTNTALSVAGGVSITKGIQIGTTAVISGVTDASSVSTGCVTLNGGIGVAKSLYVGTGIYGTLMTAAQTNITSIGTLSNLTVANSISASTLTGTINTASQPNITSIGTLASLSVTGSISASTISGTLDTPAQPNITSVGTLSAVAVSGSADATSITTGSIKTTGGVGIAKSLYVGTGIYGTLMTASQTNITSVGTLFSLAVTNGISASTLTGTISTAAQPNITSVGTLIGLTVGGSTSITNTTDATSISTGSIAVAGGVGIQKSLWVGTGINGLIMTGSQSNITSLGTLTSLLVSGGATIGTNLSTAGTTTLKTLVISNDVTTNTSTGTIAITGSDLHITTTGSIVTNSPLKVDGTWYINDTLVTSSATQLNYCNVTPGVATPLKAVVLDASSTLDTLKLTIPLDETSGGTGKNTYAVGDLLVADTTTSLKKLPISTNTGDLLRSSALVAGNVQWSPGLLVNYVSMAFPVLTATKQYSIDYLYAKNKAITSDIIIPTPTIVDGNIITANTLNSVVRSATLTGTSSADPLVASNTGTGTAFSTDFVAGDVITVFSGSVIDSRIVTSTVGGAALTVNTPFTLLNAWSLVGTATLSTLQFKFGTKSLLISNVATAYAAVTLGKELSFDASAAAWTVDLQVRLADIGAAYTIMNSTSAFAFAISFAYNAVGNDYFSVSLGNNGTTYNIANAVTSTQTILAATTWYHVALVFTGSAYIMYINGTGFTIVTSALKISTAAFQSMRIGANGTTAYSGNIDEVRISNIARYTANFAAPTVAFVRDANTVMLQHFDATTISLSDECVANRTFPYYRGGAYGISYLYGLNHATTPGYILSSRNSSQTLVDLPTGYSNTDYAPINFHISHWGNNNFQLSDREWVLAPMMNIISGATNTTQTTYNLTYAIPYNCKAVVILLTHTHVGTISAAVRLGSNMTGSVQPYLTTAIANVLQMSVTIPLLANNLTIEANLTAVATTTNYTLQIAGYYV
jgi:hypothetical protein